jgi:hypothetical protein
MKVVVGFSTSSMIFSKIIRFVTRSKVSHCYLRIYDEFLKTSIVFHVERTVCIVRSQEFDAENFPKEEFEIDDPRLDAAIADALKHLGKKFNWIDWFGWMPLLSRLVKVKIKERNYNFKKMICLNLPLHILNEAGVTHLPYGVMTPELFRQWCNEFHKELGWKKTLSLTE